MNNLNYFIPYESKTPWHEDQLTRAFLVVLRLVPLAHAAFLDLIRETQAAYGGEQIISPFSVISSNPITIDTQVQTISQDSGVLISILLTDEHWSAQTVIEPTERAARYDGVICYSPEWILVIENKPSSSNVWENQLKPSKDSFPPDSEITIYDHPVVLPWRRIIERVTSLIAGNSLQGTESLLIEDFLEYVDNFYPYLNPYTSLGVCKEKEKLLIKRCLQIMEEIAPSKVESHRGFKPSIRISHGPVKEIYLYPEENQNADWKIVLSIHPGDTTNQAREFFNTVIKEKYLSLMERGWVIEPHLHFSFMATNLVWPKTELDVRKYFDYWIINKNEIRQVQRDPSDFRDLFDRLLKKKMISKSDIPLLEEKFINTKRNAINICPGFKMSFSWSLRDAIKIDNLGKLKDAVNDKIVEAFDAWGAKEIREF